MTTSFVGRTMELGAVDGLVTALGRGHGGTLVVVGEPGIGKTHLLTELTDRADAQGHLTLVGTASETDRDVPFWVFMDALDEYVRGLDPGLLAELGEDELAQLAQVLPGVQGLAGGAGASVAHERYRSHRSVRLLLERLAADAPLVLVLDDIHWADAGSLELLMTLLRRPPAAPVLLALALRPHLIPERVASGLERAERGGSLTRIELPPLTLEEASELLDGADPATTTALYTETGGNPFYLEQLARSLARGTGGSAGYGDSSSLVGIDVPAAVAAAMMAELAELTAEARLVLQAAAVVGDPFEPELAAAAAGIEELRTLAALDELLARGLIHATDVPRRFRFRHPIVRRAVYEAAPGGWRLGAHERCALALARSGATASLRARHVELSARHGDPIAVAVLQEAGDAAARRAPATAARWFAGALRLLADDAPAERRVELLLARATALAATGQFADSREALVESIRVAPEGATALRIRLVTKCAIVEHQLGRYSEAQARLERALQVDIDARSTEAVALMVELAINALFRADFAAMDAWGRRAIDAAAPLGDRRLTATATAVQAAGAAMAGASAVGLSRCDQAAQVVDSLSDEDLAEHLDALTHVALAEMYLDRFEDARRHADRATTISRATGQGDYLAPISAVLGSCLWVRGRTAEAIDVLEGAVEGARLMDDAHGLCWTLFNLADAASAAGEVEAALAAAEESRALAAMLDPGPVPAHAAGALALALLNVGQPARAAELLPTAAGGDDLPMIAGPWRGRHLETLTRCYLAAGRRAEAERTARAAHTCAQDVGLPSATAMANLATAAIDLADGASEPAARGALAAVTALESVGHAYDTARARLMAGRALALAGHRERAIAELERAAEDFGAFGAERFRAEAERELRRLGRAVYRRSVRGTSADGVEALTQRELQLARLVVDRKTNREIAAELFLSQKTVETHLRNIFGKVGVSSRVELARAVERAGRDSV